MTIKDIVKISSILLDRADVKDYCNGQLSIISDDTTKTLSTLTDLTNLVVSELAESYIPAVKSQDVTAVNNRVYYSSLSEKPLKILKVKDANGIELKYGYAPEYILVDRNKVTVEYEYLPKTKTLNENICYEEKDVSARIIAYGVAAEFCIVTGEFNQAITWHKRYTDGIASICLPENRNLKTRSFI